MFPDSTAVKADAIARRDASVLERITGAWFAKCDTCRQNSSLNDWKCSCRRWENGIDKTSGTC